VGQILILIHATRSTNHLPHGGHQDGKTVVHLGVAVQPGMAVQSGMAAGLLAAEAGMAEIAGIAVQLATAVQLVVVQQDQPLPLQFTTMFPQLLLRLQFTTTFPQLPLRLQSTTMFLQPLLQLQLLPTQHIRLKLRLLESIRKGTSNL